MFYWSWIGEPVLIVRTDLEWVVSPSLIYGFWLHFWYLQTCLVKQNYTEHCHTFVLFLLAIVLSVLLWYTDSDYLLGIFKLFLISFFYLIVNNTYYYNIIFFNLYLIYLNNKDTTDTQKYVSYFNLQLEIDNWGSLKTKLYDKRLWSWIGWSQRICIVYPFRRFDSFLYHQHDYYSTWQWVTWRESNKKSVEIPKVPSEAASLRTDNTMANDRKGTKRQTTIYKTLHITLKFEQHEPH
jgi:hypothetical protein